MSDKISTSGFQFEVLCGENCSFRRGQLVTPHGIIETPAFWCVGTVGTVKLLAVPELEATNAQGMLSNTYHLLLRPGVETLKSFGGLHQWSAWKKPLLTDSGGFQVMSLAHRRVLSEHGVVFQSHIDGTKYELTPESAVDIQRAIGADIIFMLDVCPAFGVNEKELYEAHERTLRWAARNRKQFQDTQALYGYEQSLWPVVQGGTDPKLRRLAASALTEWGDLGYAIGGLAVGEPKELMMPALQAVTETLPAAAPKHLLGVGTPEDLLDCIALGIDTFDCVLPARNARHGIGYTSSGVVRIKNERYKIDTSPLDPECECICCQTISRSFLRHLYFASEATAQHYLTIHNLTYYNLLLAQARDAISTGRYAAFMSDTKQRWLEIALQ